MSTYAVGDVQGCYAQLQEVLELAAFGKKDRLWFVGDLVSRGPDSLQVLRFARDLGERATVVLGNHDLHLLAIHHGIRKPKKKEYLDTLLGAPDREDLVEWLATRKLAHHDPRLDYFMVHGGLHPHWSVQESMQLAGEVEQALRSKRRKRFLTAMYGDEPANWDDKLTGMTRLRVITNYLTRMRICDAQGHLDLEYKKDETEIPRGWYPWFAVPGRVTVGQPIVCGHWAALGGRSDRADVIALDTGCVWGGLLTLMRLEDQQRYTSKPR